MLRINLVYANELLTTNPNNLPLCGQPDLSKYNDVGIGGRTEKWNKCWGKIEIQSFQIEFRNYFMEDILEGEWKNGNLDGIGVHKFVVNYTSRGGDIYVGEFKKGKMHGKGIYTKRDGVKLEGMWDDDDFIAEMAVNLFDSKNQGKNSSFQDEKQLLVEGRDKFEKEKRKKEQTRHVENINLKITNTQPDETGVFFIYIQANNDIASLKIDGKEEGGREDGNYTIKRVARAGQTSLYKIVATDVYGATVTKNFSVTRNLIDSNITKYQELNPVLVKLQPKADAVAIIMGIQNYKRVPKAEYANNDAQSFYDYAIRALGVKPENIKLLVDEQADEVEILSAFQNWLPVKVHKQKTDVYVYYSGHGLPSDDGTSLYILPYGADKQFIAKTAINQQEIIAALQAVQPKSVTMFMDACYSGQIRTGENLITSSRPISIKSNAQVFPEEFTVITASQSDQVASSSSDFQHGIFSYYLMKGMEGDADQNKDNKITTGELRNYLSDMVSRKAISINRKQMPQLIGDPNIVLIGK